MYEQGLTIKQYTLVLLSITVDAAMIIAFVKVLQLLCEHEMRFNWEFGLVVCLFVSIKIYGLS